MSEARVITGLKMALEASDSQTQDRYIQAMIKRARAVIARSEAGDLPDLGSTDMREQAKAIRHREGADRKRLRDLVEAKLRVFNPDYVSKK